MSELWRRDAAAARELALRIARRVSRPWRLMEVCGGQTHSIVRYGLDGLLPRDLELIHGPGCPVCVTPAQLIDRACELARAPGVTVASFGDMLRVPGSRGDLQAARRDGGEVQLVYSPLDALAWARRHPDRQVVFFAVGFETTLPATALCVRQARDHATPNFSLLVAHVRVPPALEAILAAPGCRVEGFLAAGHVCTVMGTEEYAPLCAAHGVPIVVTGFEPLDLLEGILLCVTQLEEGRAEVENQYARAVRSEGNAAARHLIDEVFEPVSREWRGMGAIPGGGLRLREPFAAFDAARRFAASVPTASADSAADASAARCHADRVLRGELRPSECPEFGRGCTPLAPLGAPMVSDEGACAAYYRYRRRTPDVPAEREERNA